MFALFYGDDATKCETQTLNVCEFLVEREIKNDKKSKYEMIECDSSIIIIHIYTAICTAHNIQPCSSHCIVYYVNG